MSTATIEDRRPSADLLAELAAGAPTEGGTAGSWPGLTFYRFTAPADLRQHRLDRGQSSSVGIVMHGGHSLVICDCPDRTCQTALGSPQHPSLCLLLEVDPTLICEVAASMVGRDRTGPGSDHAGVNCLIATLDDDLTGSVLRFLRSLPEVSDRQVLAPLYLRELVYRILQRDRDDRLTRIANQQVTVNPVAAALDYVTAHLGEPLTVSELARQVNLSPSAFSRLFREVTGCSPYQFVKERRLNWARELLEAQRLGVTDVSRTVGYTSCSHFIKEFRARFGSTPGDYMSLLKPTPVARR